MDFDNGCPEKEGHSLLERLGVPVQRGMTKPRIEAILGKPVQAGRYFMDYVFGTKWKYDVGLIFGANGLSRVLILRKDMADAQRATGR